MRKVWTNCNLTRTLFSYLWDRRLHYLNVEKNGLATLRAVSGYVENESKTHKKTFTKMQWDIVRKKMKVHFKLNVIMSCSLF